MITSASPPPTIGARPWLREQKALPVRADRVAVVGGMRKSGARTGKLKQRPGRTGFERRAGHTDIGGVQVVVVVEEQLPGVAAPAREGAAVNRNLPLARAIWERLDVDLRSPGFER